MTRDSFNLVVNRDPVVVKPIADQTASTGEDFCLTVPGDTFHDPGWVASTGLVEF
ncbi:MAG: hypothetical protein EBE86_007680 [Hormoscilla sp. GUM202]|nr:hypothetical protein [Hormoscilla sp. GUM202]